MSNEPWYDTEAGIRNALARGLQGFHELHRERAVAYSERSEQLTAWIVAGRFMLDACGQAWIITAGHEQLLDDVIRFIRLDAHLTCSARPIAPHNAVCDRCGQAWELRDAHDYRPIHGAGVNGTDVIHMHASCRRFGIAEQARADITAAVREAGIDGDLLAVPNRYGSEDYAGPWFTTTTPSLGRVTIGWRRRVVQIEWERGPDGREVFADDFVTTGERLVHARRHADVTAYLQRLQQAAKAD